MTTLDQALQLAARGFHIFPCRENSKLPAIKDYPTRATRNEDQLRKWFKSPRNIGISTSRFAEDDALVVIDVDTKKGKRGNHTLLQLELDGLDLPTTLEHETASGGRHLIYRTLQPLKQGTDVLGSGLDIRSRGGYIVAPGSSIDGKPYQQVNGHAYIADAPEWIIKKLGVDSRPSTAPVDLEGVDDQRARVRGLSFLETCVGVSEGSRGSTAYKIAARLKDLGCTEEDAFQLLNLFWADKCTPEMPEADLQESVAHAFRYGKEPRGSAAPEVAFSQPPPKDPPDRGVHPFAKLNEEFAFIKKGAFVLQETTDVKGRFTTEHLSLVELHGWFANKPWSVGKKEVPISQAWVQWSGRRQYEGVVFMPQKDPGPRWYNLWRGFNVEPAASGKHPAVDAFLEHALQNVCGGDHRIFSWLLGYFAHMVQRPWEKPLVALVFKGKKGTGKNALVERVGALFSNHFLVADDDRYLLSNFNSHLESNLFFVLDEAAWAGDKRAESKLKGLITGTHHNIERKGQEPYRADNLTRVAIIGNEDWLVPASHDERRFAVFNVGEGRIQDRGFFQAMRVQMEQGAYAHLLRFLLDWKIETDVNDAPKTDALIEQKHASLELVEQWWLDCLSSGQLAGGDFGGEWPEAVPTNRLRDALARWARARNIRSRLPEEVGFGRTMARIAPSFRKRKARPDQASDTSYAFLNPGLDKLRHDWDRHIGGSVKWPE